MHRPMWRSLLAHHVCAVCVRRGRAVEGLHTCDVMLCYFGMRALCGIRAESGSAVFCSDEVTVAIDTGWVACLHACKNTQA